jgi:hypothetical protein
VNTHPHTEPELTMRDTTDDVRELQRAAVVAGDNDGWLHAESVYFGQGGGHYSDPVVPAHFTPVARWYVAAFSSGVTDCLRMNTDAD